MVKRNLAKNNIFSIFTNSKSTNNKRKSKECNISQNNILKKKKKKKDILLKRGLEGLVTPKGREKLKNSINLKKTKSLQKLTTIFELNINESFEKKYDKKYNNENKEEKNDTKYKTSNNFYKKEKKQNPKNN